MAGGVLVVAVFVISTIGDLICLIAVLSAV